MPFTKPVVLLTHRFSVSAAENFALAMRTLPHVIQAGDATSGAFADTAPHTLPNGWRFSAPFNLFRDRDGFCWEGIGIPPDYRQLNTKADIDAKRDRVLELAIALIESGAKPRPAHARVPRNDEEPRFAQLRAPIIQGCPIDGGWID